MKTIIEILQEKKIDLNIVNDYRYDALSSKGAKIIVDTLYSEYRLTEKEYVKLKAVMNEKDKVISEQKQLLTEANSKVETLEACVDTQVKAIDKLREENKLLKNGIDDYSKRMEETNEILKDKNTAIESLNSTIEAYQYKLTAAENDLIDANNKISAKETAIEVIDEENKKLKEELISSKKACDVCSLIKLDTQYNSLNQAYNQLNDENYVLKQAYESKDTQVGDLIRVLSKLVND